MNAEHVFLQVVTGGECFRAEVASMIALVEVNSKDMPSDARLVSEGFAAPIAAQLCILVSSSYVSLKSVGFEERSTTEAATESRF